MGTMTHSFRRRRSSLGVPRGLIIEGMDRESLLIEAIHRLFTDPCGHSGARGAACFRRGSTPVVVVVTDAPTHNGRSGNNGYDHPAATFEETVEPSSSTRAIPLPGSTRPVTSTV